MIDLNWWQAGAILASLAGIFWLFVRFTRSPRSAANVSCPPNCKNLRWLNREREIAAKICDTAPAIILILNRSGMIQYANPFLLKLTGWRMDEIRGKDWFSTFLPERDRARIRELFARSTKGTPARSNINPIVTRAGEEREIEWNDQLLEAANEQEVSILAIGIDVTDRQRESREFRASEIRMRQILDGLFGFVGLYTVDGILIDANEAPLRIADLKREDVLGLPFWDTYWWSYDKRVQQELRASMERAAQGETVRYQPSVRVKDGALITIDVTFSPIRNNLGEITHLLGFAIDITERERAESALHRNEIRLKQAQKIARIGNWELEVSSGLLHWSDEVFRIFEVHPAEFSTTYEAFLQRVHPDDRERVEKAYSDSLRDRNPYSIVHRLRLADGRIKFVEERCETEFAPDGSPVISRGTVQDVTDRVSADETIRRSLVEKETLLREIHHRVKNNLQTVTSLLYFQAKKVADPKASAVFGEIQTQMRAIILVHEKLYSSDTISGLEFSDYARTLAKEISHLASPNERRISLTVHAEPRRLPVETALPCGLILVELLTNTIKHAFPNRFEGTVSIHIANGDDHFTISVRDDGAGLPENLDLNSTNSFGWRMIRNLTAQIRGEISLKSEEGTCVTLTVPLPDPERSIAVGEGPY